MLNQAPIWAVLRAVDLARAKTFYTENIGLSEMEGMSSDSMLVFSCGDGTGLLIYPRPDTQAPVHTVGGWNVKDLDAEMAELRAKGVTFEEYDMPELKTENGVATMGPIKSAWFKDSEGNILSIAQM